MTVAIPVFNGAVAPCFEAARTFLLATLVDRRVSKQELVESGGCEGFGRIQLLRDRTVTVLICNGIKAFYRDLLRAAGVEVIAGVAGPAGTALEEFCAGRLAQKEATTCSVDLSADIPLEDLVCWTRELFLAHGYTVRLGENAAPFPIDLIAEISCPACGRPVRVAICCGAHAYRPEQEILSLHLAAGAGYDARIYIHAASTRITQNCDQYGIELIDPDAKYARRDHPDQNHIPVLLRPVPGHERAAAQPPEELI